MLIANPIYDVVFKHIMEDISLARGMVSRLLQLNVLELVPYPQEISTQFQATATATPPASSGPAAAVPMIRVYRVDFAALVEMEDGSRKKVLIELQKSQATDEIERFRSYLGLHYSRRDEEARVSAAIRPIVPIYVLGFLLNRRLPKIVKVTRHYINGATGEPLGPEVGRDDFIDKLSHDLLVVQLGKDEELGDTGLGRMLALFDQSKVSDASRHYLVVNLDGSLVEDEFIMLLVRKLGEIAADPETQTLMQVEDELTASFARKDQEIAKAQAETAKAQAQVTKERRQKEEERRQKEAAVAQKEEERRQKEEAVAREAEERRQKEEALREMEALRARLRELEK